MWAAGSTTSYLCPHTQTWNSPSAAAAARELKSLKKMEEKNRPKTCLFTIRKSLSVFCESLQFVLRSEKTGSETARRRKGGVRSLLITRWSWCVWASQFCSDWTGPTKCKAFSEWSFELDLIADTLKLQPDDGNLWGMVVGKSRVQLSQTNFNLRNRTRQQRRNDLVNWESDWVSHDAPLHPRIIQQRHVTAYLGLSSGC